MDRRGQVLRDSAHFDRKRGLADRVRSSVAHETRTENERRGRVQDQPGHPHDVAARRVEDLMWNAGGRCRRCGQSAPRDLRICIYGGRDGPGVEHAVAARGDLRRHPTLGLGPRILIGRPGARVR